MKLLFLKKCRIFFLATTLITCVGFLSCETNDNMEEAVQIYTIGGIVTKSDGGTASGASVMIVKESDGSNVGESPTNAAGEYVIPGISAGSYKVVVALSGYETATVSNITVTNTDVTVDEILLQKITVPTFSISGTVTKPDGSAAEGTSIQVLNSVDNSQVGQVATTDNAGLFTINEIPSGKYILIISLEGFETGILSDVTVNNANLTALDHTLKTIEIDADAVSIVFSGTNATVENLPSDGSITVSKDGAHITIATTALETIEYYVSGSTTDGSLKIQNNASSPNTIKLTLNSVSIVSSTKLPPIQITKNEGITIIDLKGVNILSDNSSNEENATLISKSGSLEFEGYGKLTISGAAKHAIGSSKKSITVRSGNIVIPSAASDGFHADVGFDISGGSLNITSSGDGIDAGSGKANLNGGNIFIDSKANDTKGIKADDGITVNGSHINMNVSGAQSKGLGSKSGITINSGEISIVTSGATILEPVGSGYDPSYCTAIKSDKDITVTGGTIQIESRSTSDGGKGISADGNVIISGGSVNITTAGDGKTYTSETGVTDSYTATCIKSDQNISLLAGQITCYSSGTGGKAINADGAITIGIAGANNANLVLNASTTGERFYVTGSSGGQSGRPGGFGDDGTDYANPKAIKCLENMDIYSGTIFVNCTQKNEGGEGLESKKTLTIHGGNIDIRTYDDCINAGTSIVINNGNIFCAASGQDAIDSNGTLVVNGGLTIANGVRGDGEAFDSEKGFQVNGGIIVGTHGGMAMTTPSGSQKSVRLQANAGSAIGIKNSSGDMLLLFNIPVISGASTGTSVYVTFSDPRLTSGTYTLLSGGSISGGVTSNGYNTGGTYNGGSSKSFSL